MSLDNPGTFLSSMIFVRNLPEKTTTTDLFNIFSKYGKVMMTMLCTDHFKNNFYFYRSAFIRFDSPSSIKDILENNINIILKGYFLDISLIPENPLIFQTVIILGIGNEIQKDQIKQFIYLYSNPKIIHFHDSSINDDGYAILQFNSVKLRDSFLISHNTLEIDNCIMGIKPFPSPFYRYYMSHISIHHFSILKQYFKFLDFKFIVFNKEYLCSSIILTFSCKIIRDLLNQNPLKKEMIIKTSGDFSIVYDCLFGSPIIINLENCHYLHHVASELGHIKLIRSSGLFCYEFLTIKNCYEILNDLLLNNYDYSYVIEFIVTHINDLPNISCLPSEIIKIIACHQSILDLSFEKIIDIFTESIINNKIQRKDIIHLENELVSVNNIRHLLTLQLSNIIDQQKNKDENLNENEENNIINTSFSNIPQFHTINDSIIS